MVDWAHAPCMIRTVSQVCNSRRNARRKDTRFSPGSQAGDTLMQCGLVLLLVSASLNWKNSGIPGARSNREVMPWKPSWICFRIFCRFSSRRVCSWTSDHVTAQMSPRLVAAATASFSSRSADMSGSHVMVASGWLRRGLIQAMESDSSKSLCNGSFFASSVCFREFASGAF